MKYTVVVPVYLREEDHREVVHNTLSSVKKNSKDYELIVVDDASPLDTASISSYADKFIRHEKNQGISVAWNTGMHAAETEWVVILNDDVLVPEGWLEALEQAFDYTETGVSAPMKGGPHVRPATIAIDPYEDHKFYPGYCFMLHKGVFYEDFDPQFTTNCGDTDYWHRIRKAGFECMRAGFTIWHKEGDVLSKMDYQKLSQESINLFIKKWGIDPQKEYYV